MSPVREGMSKDTESNVKEVRYTRSVYILIIKLLLLQAICLIIYFLSDLANHSLLDLVADI